MKKTILKLEVHNDKEKRKVMKRVSALAGVDSISMDMKDKKLSVIGDIDPVKIATKLRKLCYAEIVSVGPAKEPEKKKDDGNKKKDEPKEDDGNKKKDEPKEDDVAELVKAYRPYNPMPYPYPGYGAAELFKVDTSYNPQNPPLTSAKKDPNACVIL